jgi:hypothetical protein
MPARRKRPKKQENRASLIILIALAFLLLVATVVFVSRLPQDEAWQLVRPGRQEAEQLSAGFASDVSQARNIYPFLDGFVRLAPERISGLDVMGNERFTVDIDFTTPFLVKNGGWLLVADQEGTGYVMLDKSGLVHQGQLEGKISGAALSQNGMAALIQEQKNSTGVVSVLAGQTGRHLYDCHFAESGYVLAAAFFAGSDYFDVSIINTDSSSLQPVIKRFDLAGNPLGQLKPALDGLTPLLVHGATGDLVLYGQKSLHALAFSSQEPLFEHAFAQIHSLVAVEDGYWLLARARSDSRVQLYFLSLAGQLEEMAQGGTNVLGPVAAGDLVALAAEDQIMVLNSKNQKLVLELAMPARIIRFDFHENNLYVVTSNGVYRLDLAG